MPVGHGASRELSKLRPFSKKSSRLTKLNSFPEPSCRNASKQFSPYLAQIIREIFSRAKPLGLSTAHVYDPNLISLVILKTIYTTVKARKSSIV